MNLSIKIIHLGWKTVSKNKMVLHDSSVPLEIKTSAEIGSRKEIFLEFLDSSNVVRGNLRISFYSTIKYYINANCVPEGKEIVIPSGSPDGWVLTVQKTEKSLTIHGDNVLITNLVFSEHMYGNCEVRWNLKPLQKIRFRSSDTASEMYRVKPRGKQ